ncbi:hypothetical protein K2W90_04690 [Candidatus Babeliales bacterium]|nr:hypothetical protein [Candidatus Babeliales bacterium]
MFKKVMLMVMLLGVGSVHGAVKRGRHATQTREAQTRAEKEPRAKNRKYIDVLRALGQRAVNSQLFLEVSRENPDLSMMSDLITFAKADVRALDFDGYNLVHCLIRNKKVYGKERRAQVLSFLVGKGVVINSFDKKGFTPLSRAIKDGDQLWVDLLVCHGADINVQDKKNGQSQSLKCGFETDLFALTEDDDY